MKHIIKNSEPSAFSDWKAADKMYRRGKPNWNRLSSTEKNLIHGALIAEQGGVCCYCCTRIDISSSHIEHFRPVSTYSELQLEYDNLLCSCQKAGALAPTEPKHCGAGKGNWFDKTLTVDPLNPSCEDRFEFLEDGAVHPLEPSDQSAIETIKELDLDLKKLRLLREGAIGASLDELDLSDEDEIRDMIRIYSQRSPDNQFAPFCVAIIQILNNLLPKGA